MGARLWSPRGEASEMAEARIQAGREACRRDRRARGARRFLRRRPVERMARGRPWIRLCLALLAWTACANEEPAQSRGGASEAAPAASDDPGPGVADDAWPSGAKEMPPHEFRSLDGQPVSLSDLRGDIVLANFWGTWCLPCRRELPELAELARTYEGRGVRVVGVAVDSGEPEDIAAFARRYGVEYEIWLTNMETSISKFGAVGYPFTLLIDREGRIRREYLGPQTFEALAADLEALE